MNTFQLSCFLAVANSLSFARAAKQLNVTQPTITHQIKMLENELEVKLFRRSTRMVEITPEGQAFLPDAQNMIYIEKQAKLRFSNPSDRPIETISIGCSNYAHFKPLTEILNDLNVKFPDFHPKLHVVPHEQLFHLLETETADVIFEIREIGKSQDKFRYKELAQCALAGVCRKDHILASKSHITINELKKEKIVLCNPFSLSSEIAKMQLKLAMDKNPADIYFCDSVEASYILVGAGIGIAVLPELFIPNENRIVQIPIDDAPSLSFGMFYNSYTDNAILKEFIQIACSHFSEQQNNTDS